MTIGTPPMCSLPFRRGVVLFRYTSALTKGLNPHLDACIRSVQSASIFFTVRGPVVWSGVLIWSPILRRGLPHLIASSAEYLPPTEQPRVQVFTTVATHICAHFHSNLIQTASVQDIFHERILCKTVRGLLARCTKGSGPSTACGSSGHSPTQRPGV